MFEIVEHRCPLPFEPLLSLEHTGDQIFAVFVKAVANVIHVDAPGTVLAVEQILNGSSQHASSAGESEHYIFEDGARISIKSFG